MTKQFINDGIAKFFKQARLNRHISKSKMANLLYIDDKTWSRYESGESSPTVGEFARICTELGESPLRSVLEIVYSESYKDVKPGADVQTLREAAVKYLQNVASDKTIRIFSFMVFGSHGSNIEPQAQELCAIDHLPLEYRILIAKLVRSCWDVAESKGELLCTSNVMPDLKLLDAGIKAGEEAVKRKNGGYSTAVRYEL